MYTIIYLKLLILVCKEVNCQYCVVVLNALFSKIVANLSVIWWWNRKSSLRSMDQNQLWIYFPWSLL